jgi:ATP-dependent RNA helicase DHX8/PRP22
VKDFLRTLVPVSVHSTAAAWQGKKINNDTQSICTVCMCEFDSPYSLQQCGHTFCRSCLISYFESHMNSTITANAFKLCCPFDKCDVPCLIRDIVSILGAEKATRLAMIAFKIHIRSPENDLVQCWGNDCDQVIDTNISNFSSQVRDETRMTTFVFSIQVYRPSKYSSTYFCDQCIKIYCLPCKAEYHMGMTCEQFQKVEKERKEKALLKKNLGDLPYKHCPKCRTLIEKYAGCNAMKCTQCGIAFCWQCSLTHDEDGERQLVKIFIRTEYSNFPHSSSLSLQ